MRYDSYHPLPVLFFFPSVILMTLLFRHPVWLAISWLSAGIYLIKLKGSSVFPFLFLLFLLSLFFGLWYAFYHHFGVTVLGRNGIGNALTLESWFYGTVLGFCFSAVALWLSCMHVLVHSDQIIYLTGWVSPGFSLFLTTLLRFVPRIRQQFHRIDLAQQALGKGAHQGSFPERMLHVLRITSMTLTWTLESLLSVSDSMRSRGILLKGRTSFSLWQFDRRNRRLLLLQLFLLLQITAAFLLGQTRMYYDPRLVWVPCSPVGILFWFFYGLYCLHPLLLQLYFEIKYKNR